MAITDNARARIKGILVYKREVMCKVDVRPQLLSQDFVLRYEIRGREQQRLFRAIGPAVAIVDLATLGSQLEVDFNLKGRSVPSENRNGDYNGFRYFNLDEVFNAINNETTYGSRAGEPSRVVQELSGAS